ncbi:MAG: LysR family transcriptional regulator [Oceanospirillaceae bacterium]|nr:LysR family transcriptional regulator [Oceanospirillaceae bacterium]
MELQQLRLFLAAAETGSFTRGAERAFVSQPALSASISKLETELGVRLFVRNKRHVALTPAGRKLLQRAKLIVGECARVKDELRQHDVHRRLRLGVVNTLSIDRVARFIEQYRQENPDVKLDVIDVPEDDMIRQQQTGRVDLALTLLSPSSTAQPGLQTRPLFEERYQVAMAPDCPLSAAKAISIRDLEKEPFVARSHCEHRPVVQALLKQHNMRLNLVYVTTQDERALALVKAGVGVAILPQHYACHQIVMRPLTEDDATRVVGFQWQPPQARVAGVDPDDNAELNHSRLEEMHRLMDFAATVPWL